MDIDVDIGLKHEEINNTIVCDRTDEFSFKRILPDKLLTFTVNDNVNSVHSSNENTVADSIKQKHDLDNFEYNFNHSCRGYAIIINNSDFQSDTGMVKRTGTDLDSSRLYTSFRKLEFDVKIFKNCSVDDMHEIISHFSKLDHSNADCFVCVVLSHGNEGVVYGTDDLITLEDLAEPLKVCRSLIGKPKIFIVQACRGKKTDPGINVISDGPSPSNRVVDDESAFNCPRETDFLWIHATPPGYYAWRNSKNGSWFIEALAEAIRRFGSTKNFLHVLAYANYICAYRFQSNSTNHLLDSKKQCSTYSSRLRKNIYFRPKHD